MTDEVRDSWSEAKGDFVKDDFGFIDGSAGVATALVAAVSYSIEGSRVEDKAELMLDGVCEDGTRRRGPVDVVRVVEGMATALSTFLAGCGLDFDIRVVINGSSSEDESSGGIITSESSLVSSLTSIDLRGRPRLGGFAFLEPCLIARREVSSGPDSLVVKHT